MRILQAAQSGAGDGARSAPAPFVRIGELSRRTGVRAETIRAWERRYGLIEPARSAGGFRLYSPRRRGEASCDARP